MQENIQHTSYKGRTVGDIAVSTPGATAVFRKFKLDFCCGGDVALEDAAAKRGVDVTAIEQDLSNLDLAAGWQAPQETGEMIDFILTRYHETHRRELPELAALSRKVEAVHAAHPDAPHGLADVFQQMIGDLEVHMKKEELMLFPLMKRGAPMPLAAPITQMRHDHDDQGGHLRRIEEITNGFALPQDACRSWQALYAGAEKLADDLMEHVHLENNVLFPRFEGAGDA